MNQGPESTAGEDRSEAQAEIGSVAEEAVKLFGALSDWARDHGEGYAGSAGGAAASVADAVHDVNEHLATGSPECTYCPLCRVVHVVRETSPEVKTHLTAAASSLMHAVAGMLATAAPEPRGEPVEKIDLDHGPWEGDS